MPALVQPGNSLIPVGFINSVERHFIGWMVHGVAQMIDVTSQLDKTLRVWSQARLHLCSRNPAYTSKKHANAVIGAIDCHVKICVC